MPFTEDAGSSLAGFLVGRLGAVYLLESHDGRAFLGINRDVGHATEAAERLLDLVDRLLGLCLGLGDLFV